ncbi:MAG: DUF4288 domain-containing protein [Candidatus Sumerlaeia bacterium]
MAKKIPCRNKSPYGWWVASILQRYEAEGEDTNNPKRRCLAWENTIILKAKDRNEAYRKAVANGKLCQSSGPHKGRWVFEGLTSLNPIYEKLEDGAEIIWQERHFSAKRIRSMVKAKKELPCFDDKNENINKRQIDCVPEIVLNLLSSAINASSVKGPRSKS